MGSERCEAKTNFLGLCDAVCLRAVLDCQERDEHRLTDLERPLSERCDAACRADLRGVLAAGAVDDARAAMERALEAAEALGPETLATFQRTQFLCGSLPGPACDRHPDCHRFSRASTREKNVISGSTCTARPDEEIDQMRSLDDAARGAIRGVADDAKRRALEREYRDMGRPLHEAEKDKDSVVKQIRDFCGAFDLKRRAGEAHPACHARPCTRGRMVDEAGKSHLGIPGLREMCARKDAKDADIDALIRDPTWHLHGK